MNLTEDEQISRFYSDKEKLLFVNAHRKLFKERLKAALDQRIGRNRKNCCSPEYHARVSGIHRTTMLRYLDVKSRVVPSFDMICVLIEYIKIFVKDFNPAYLFDESATMTK